MKEEPRFNKKPRRTFHSESKDLIHWSEPWEVIPPDEKDPGQFEYYARAFGHPGHSSILVRIEEWPGCRKECFDNFCAADL